MLVNPMASGGSLSGSRMASGLAIAIEDFFRRFSGKRG